MYHTTNNIQYDFGSDLMNQVGNGVMGAVGGIPGMGMGILSNAIGGAMQIGQQNQMSENQLKMNEQLSSYNYGLQKDMWDYTNFENQVKHLNAAGLNPALLYAKGGMGGTTGTPTTGAGMGIASNQAAVIEKAATDTQQQKAQIALTQAQTDNLNADTKKKAGPDTNLVNTQIQSLTQGIQNQQAQQALTQIQTALAKTQADIAANTQQDAEAQIRANASTAQQQFQIIQRNNWMDQQTMQDRKNMVSATLAGQYIENGLKQAQTNMTDTEIQQITTQMQQQWKQLDINQQNANTQQKLQELQTWMHNLRDKSSKVADGLMKLIPYIAF